MINLETNLASEYSCIHANVRKNKFLAEFCEQGKQTNKTGKSFYLESIFDILLNKCY